MKAVAYLRVSKIKQETTRQLSDLEKTSYQIEKVFSDKVSGYSTSIKDRTQFQKAVKYLEQSVDCKTLLIHEISRLGRNNLECLTTLKELEQKGISVYIHTLGITLGTDNNTNQMFSKLIVGIFSQMAEMESQQMSERVKSSLRAKKERGEHIGRQFNSTESKEKFLSKHKSVIKLLNMGRSYREISKLTGGTSTRTITKVKKVMLEE